jgi:hypothetical protein
MKIEIGSKVAYSVQFLKSIGMSHSEMAKDRGTVIALEPLGNNFLAVVDWNDPTVPKRILTSNLAIVGLNTKFCQC